MPLEDSPPNFEDTCGHIEFQLTSAIEDAQGDEFANSREQVLLEARSGLAELHVARSVRARNEDEAAWWHLVQAARCAGAAAASLSGAWVRPVIDLAVIGERGGRGKGVNFKQRRAKAADDFLARRDSIRTQTEARQELDSAISRNSMLDIAGARAKLFRERPDVKAFIASVPKYVSVKYLAKRRT